MKKLSLTLVSLLITISVNAQLNMDAGAAAPGASEEEKSSSDYSNDKTPVQDQPTQQEPPTPLEPDQPLPPLMPPSDDSNPMPPVTDLPTLPPPSVDEPGLEPPAVVDPTPAEPPLPILWGEPGYAGTGCTAGNLLMEHDDHGNLLILLAPMLVDGSNPKAPFARSACSVRIPLTVPAGHKIVILQSLNEGRFSVSEGDKLTLTQEAGFVGAGKISQTLDLIQNDDGVLAWDSAASDIIAESSCDKTESMLALNTNALLVKSASGQSSISHLALDSISLQLTVEKCE